MKQQQTQKIQQKILPQQILINKLLEIPIVEMEERIRSEIEDNPALEECDAVVEPNDEIDSNFEEEEMNTSDDEHFEENYDDDNFEDDIPDYKLKTNNFSNSDASVEIPFQNEVSFHEYLMEQMELLDFNQDDYKIAEYIVGNIDGDGYLQRSVEDIADDIAFQTSQDFSVEKISQIVEKIQTLEPAGVASKDLRECLLLQLKRKKQSPSVISAEKILSNFFEEFSKRQYEIISKNSSLSENDIKSAIDEINKLNPKPGSAWNDSVIERSSNYVVPDFILENNDGELSLSLNEKNMPSLRVVPKYDEMLKKYSVQEKQNKKSREVADFIKKRIDAANNFMEAIHQRQVTLLTTMNAIINRQREYFLCGDDKLLKPMIMKDIANDTGFDISTVSRVSNSKYIQTEFGFFPLKFFFSQKADTQNGEDVSVKEIIRILQEVIDAEDKKKPYSDEELTGIFKGKGFNVARRTIAKYRELNNIPAARMRKKL